MVDEIVRRERALIHRRKLATALQSAPDSCSAGPAIKTVTVLNGRLARAEYNFTHVSVQ
jgi:hypothetical protein